MIAPTDLQAMVYDYLSAHPSLNALGIDRIWDKPPITAPYPRVVFGHSDWMPEPAECINAGVESMVLHVWSQAQDGKREAKLIVAALVAALDGWRGDERIAMGPARVVRAFVDDDPDGVSLHGVVQVEAPVES